MPTTIINASAGSGKTYRLAVAYLQALLQPLPDGTRTAPQHVLATTFTRAAASEILERVLCRLALAVVSDAERQTLLGEIGQPDVGREELSALLGSVCQALSQLQVGTLDALFARVVRVMGLDLAFPAAWTVSDETLAQEMALEAADRMLRGEDARTQWERWLRYTQFKSGITVRQALVDLLEDNRFLLANHPGIGDDTPGLEKPLQLQLEEAAELVAALDAFDIPRTKGKLPQPHKSWVKAIEQLKSVLQNEPTLISVLSGSSLIRLAHLDESSYYKVPIPDSLREILRPLIARARDDLRRLHEARLPALAALAGDYHRHRQAIAYASGAYRFPEIETAVLSLPSHLFDHDLYFRLDGQIQHLLVDEFQDTSLSQFRFLYPIIEEVRSQNRLFFAVGDVKQSIYGWRGAERQLLTRLRDWLDPAHQDTDLRCETLRENYRSSPAVLDAIRRVFENLDQAPCLDEATYTDAREKERAEIRRLAASSFISTYEPPKAAGASQHLAGQVRLLVTESKPAEGEDSDEKSSPEVDTIIRAVLQHRDEDPEREIAILCRRRKWIPSILARLQMERIEASGEGGSAVTDSAAVELVLSMLTWLDHPGHTLAKAHVELSGIGAVFGFDGISADGALARKLHTGIMRKGLVAVMSDWVRHEEFRRKCSIHDRVRSEQLVELARHWDTAGGGRLSHFVQRVRTQRLENPISARVRVMTIHSSKGLEFEAVILADLQSTGGRNDGPRFVTTMSTPGILPDVQLLPSQDHAEWLGLEELHQRHQQNQFEEDLSVLYVGLTRAKSFLDVVVPAAEKAKATLDGILRERWGHSEAGEHLIESRSATPVSASMRTQMGRDQAIWRPDDRLELPRFVKIPAHLAAKTPSGQEGSGQVKLGHILQRGDSPALERGTAVHALLSRIEWNEKLPAMEDWIRSIPSHEAKAEACRLAARDLYPRFHAPTDGLVQAFDRSLTMAGWKSAGVVDLEVWRERRFAVVFDQELMNGSFDRVVIGLDAKGERICAEILDFKTDRIATAAERDLRQQFYQPQLEAYSSALHKLTGLPAHSIRTRLVWLSALSVV